MAMINWHGILIVGCIFICGVCVGSIFTNRYWRRRINWLSASLDHLKAQQDLVNKYYAGEIDKAELERRLSAFFDNPETLH